MADAFIEHLNITVSNPEATAKMLCDVFGWKVRWQGKAIHEGTTIHVGSETDYLAVYAMGGVQKNSGNTYETCGGLNHVGIVVDDLDATEAKVIAAGFTPTSHADYEPGRRFYFHDADDIEFEIVSYK